MPAMVTVDSGPAAANQRPGTEAAVNWSRSPVSVLGPERFMTKTSIAHDRRPEHFSANGRAKRRGEKKQGEPFHDGRTVTGAPGDSSRAVS